ncbi:MAG: SPOR domain-containing protein [Gammaproteobacteria bacterium]|nr:SPOR domain-containing protein [Gammaproteobacteria bacterium]MDP6731758.1 SPOR domain-containing protein [Gammaproteobacteria bacterium]
MKQGTKQRIVGTVVLLALALIFLPIIFDGQGSYQNQISSRIPATPVVPILPEPQQVRPVIIADAEVAEVEPTEAEPTPSANTETTPEPAVSPVEVSTSEPAFTREIPSLDSSGLPQGWSVRLGSFSDESNADTLLERLQAAGYRAYTRAITSEQGALTGVFVGPWLERSMVQDYQERLQQEFQLAGMVVRYVVEQL